MKTKILKKYYLSVLAYIISNLLMLSIPLLFSYLIDEIILNKKYGELKLWFLIILSLSILSCIASFYFTKYIPVKKGIENSILLQNNVLRNILKMNVPIYQEKDKSYYFNTLVNSTGCYGDLHEEIYLHFISNIFCIIIILIFTFVFNKLFGLLFLIYIPILVLISLSQSKTLFQLQKDAIIKQDDWMSSSKNIIENKREINVLQANNFFESLFKKSSEIWKKYILKYRFYEYLVENIPSILNNLYSVFFLLLGTILIRNERITLGILILGYQYLNYISTPIADATNILIRYYAGKEHINRIDDLDHLAEVPNEIAAFQVLKNKLFEANNFTFKIGKDGQENFLYKIENLSLEMNKFYVIKGGNGTGKTTFLNLIAGYISVNNFDGDLKVTENINNIAFLTYPMFILNGSLSDNLFNRPYNTELNDILNIDFQDKQITTNPINLSLGQQQKIALLRVFSMEKDILFLDEPFSNLDACTQQELKKYLKRIKGSKTIIFIMHDNFLDDISDEILLIKDHKLVSYNSIT